MNCDIAKYFYLLCFFKEIVKLLCKVIKKVLRMWIVLNEKLKALFESN